MIDTRGSSTGSYFLLSGDLRVVASTFVGEADELEELELLVEEPTGLPGTGVNGKAVPKIPFSHVKEVLPLTIAAAVSSALSSYE